MGIVERGRHHLTAHVHSNSNSASGWVAYHLCLIYSASLLQALAVLAPAFYFLILKYIFYAVFLEGGEGTESVFR